MNAIFFWNITFMYSTIRNFLFYLDPETAHRITLNTLKFAHKLGLTFITKKSIQAPRTVMGLTFPNPIGLAAGLDNNADYIDALGSLGFGFIEIGGVTPKPQPGNPKPRIFRLVDQHAIINRMGFHNKGVAHVAKQLEKTTYRGILGINIAKNAATPLERAVDDYLICVRALWKYASYFTINISSPNTPGLRDMQKNNLLDDLFESLKMEQHSIEEYYHKYVPLVVKISPDLSDDELKELAGLLLKHKIDGVIATNTTVKRDGVQGSEYANELGGLSGRPLKEISTRVISQLHGLLQGKIPIIGSGGVVDRQAAEEKIKAGAVLLQTYTGFIYNGPAIIEELAKAFTPPSPT
jgi:dihydroorotate dehydrogenase